MKEYLCKKNEIVAANELLTSMAINSWEDLAKTSNKNKNSLEVEKKKSLAPWFWLSIIRACL